MFKIGDTVKCVDASIDAEKAEEIKRDFENWIIKDSSYTVRGFVDNDGIVVGMWLEEVHNFPKFFRLIGRTQEPAFATWRFEKTASAPQEQEEEEDEMPLELQELLEEQEILTN